MAPAYRGMPLGVEALLAPGGVRWQHRPGAPEHARCDGAEGALLEKARAYDRLVGERHQPAGQDLVHSVPLTPDLGSVERYDLSDNAGGWSAVYGAAEAFRSAVTGEADALEAVKRILRGQETLMRSHHLDGMGLDLDCQTNWNNHHMAQLAMFSLLQYEEGASLRRRYQDVLLHQLWDAADPRPMRVQDNAMFTFFFEVQRAPEMPRPAAELDRAVYILGKFPLEKFQRQMDNSSYRRVGGDRKGDPLTDTVIPFEEREIDRYVWKKNPYAIEKNAEDKRGVESPEDHLLAYWAGRYYRLFDPGL